tara:strand:+ start:68324 stop:68683 length:360 start_codon:yes stop_codon:yes gene_type:complete
MNFSILLKKSNWRLSVSESTFKLKFEEIVLANSYEEYKDLLEQLRLYRVRRNNSCYIRIFNSEANTNLVLQRKEIQNLCLLIVDINSEIKLIKNNTLCEEQLACIEQTTPSFEKQLFKN